MITERTLKRWRRESLSRPHISHIAEHDKETILRVVTEQDTRILRMTQELLDQHLMRRDS